MQMKNSPLTITFAFTLSVTASVLSPTFAADDGKAEYDKTCLACHASAMRLIKKVTGADKSKKQEFLETYLTTHHAPDAGMRRAIITYLLSI